MLEINWKWLPKNNSDWKILLPGVVLAVLSVLLLTGYQVYHTIKEGSPYITTPEMERKATVDGYETPEEVVEYVLYQIARGDLDLALRGCAIEEVAEYFSLKSYCELLDSFPYTGMLAPADHDSQAYREINEARMLSVYSDMIGQCMGIFGEGYDLEIVSVEADIPADADGYYYQEIRDVCDITGARDACDVKIHMLVDGIPREMVVTAGRYKRHWKVLQFSAYKNYLYTEPQISEYARNMDGEKLEIPWEEFEDDILPCNYKIAASKTWEDPKELVEQLFLYLQQGEIWRAMACYDLYDSEETLSPDGIFYSRQSAVAEELQRFYYWIFLYDTDKMSWINQNVKTEAENLVGLLDTSEMIYSEFLDIKKIWEGEGQVQYQATRHYWDGWGSCTVTLVYKDGWKVSSLDIM